MADIPAAEKTDHGLLLDIHEDLRYLRRLLAEFEPLLSALRGNGTGNAVAMAGLRKAVRKGTGNAATSSHG